MQPAHKNLVLASSTDYASESAVQFVAQRLASQLSVPPRSIILTGSFARHEGSAIFVDGIWRVLGDMEFLVVFADGLDRGPLQLELGTLARTVSMQLAEIGVQCELEFRAINSTYFKVIQPSIFAAELLRCGCTVWGETDLLASAPRSAAGDPPIADGWRMLNNRIIEQLDIPELFERDSAQWGAIAYRVSKLYLDLGTVTLVFMRQFCEGYEPRAARISKLAEDGKLPESFGARLSQRVSQHTQQKLHPSERIQKRSDLLVECTDAAGLVLEVRQWAAGFLTKCNPDSRVSPSVLASVSLGERLRGWGKLMSLTPAVKRLETGLRALKLLKSSPRYLVYEVAAELYRAMPSLLRGEPVEVPTSLENELPFVFVHPMEEPRPWYRLRDNTVQNWRVFLRNNWA